MNLSELLKISISKIVFYIIALASIFGNGFLIIYLLNKQLFIDIDTLKLVFLSLGVSMPTYVINFFILTVGFMGEESTEDNNDLVIMYTGVLNMLVLGLFSLLLLLWRPYLFFFIKIIIMLESLFFFISVLKYSKSTNSKAFEILSKILIIVMLILLAISIMFFINLL